MKCLIAFFAIIGLFTTLFMVGTFIIDQYELYKLRKNK